MKVRHLFLNVLWIGLILISLTACDAVLAQFCSESERYRLESDRLLSEGRTAEAILSFRAAVQNDKVNLPAVKTLAGLYAGQGRRRMVQRLLETAIALAPRDRELSQSLVALGSTQPSGGLLALRWQIRLGESEPIGFTADSDRVYVSLDDGSVICVDAAGGQVRWQRKLPAKATSAPGVAAGRLWVGAQNGVLYTLSADSGEIAWQYPTKAPVYVPPTLGPDTAYLASGDSTLYALGLTDGSLKWSFTTDGPLHTRPTLSGGILYFGSNDAQLYALEAASGKPFWKDGILTQGAVESQAVVDSDRVYFGSGDARVYSLAGSSGGEYWRFSTPDAVYASVVISGGVLYAASAGNTLTALDKISGKKLW